MFASAAARQWRSPVLAGGFKSSYNRSVSGSVSTNAHAMATSTTISANGFRRFLSVITTSPEAKFYDYDGVKAIATEKELDPKIVLVDVREPSEFAEGHIPHAVNIPYKSLPGALDLSPEEFEEHFGFEKPGLDKELVFYCLGGVRSTAAEELASNFGYKKRGNYVGSWEDWIAHEQPSAAAAAPTSATSGQDSAKL